MIGWHHQLSGHDCEQTVRDGEGQGSLVCFSPWHCKGSDMTERLNNNAKKDKIFDLFLCVCVCVQVNWNMHLYISLEIKRQVITHFHFMLLKCFFWDQLPTSYESPLRSHQDKAELALFFEAFTGMLRRSNMFPRNEGERNNWGPNWITGRKPVQILKRKQMMETVQYQQDTR